MGVELIDPALATANAKMIQGHLHYRVDDGPVTATPVTKLADSNHQPLGPRQSLDVIIPANFSRHE